MVVRMVRNESNRGSDTACFHNGCLDGRQAGSAGVSSRTKALVSRKAFITAASCRASDTLRGSGESSPSRSILPVEGAGDGRDVEAEILGDGAHGAVRERKPPRRAFALRISPTPSRSILPVEGAGDGRDVEAEILGDGAHGAVRERKPPRRAFALRISPNLNRNRAPRGEKGSHCPISTRRMRPMRFQPCSFALVFSQSCSMGFSMRSLSSFAASADSVCSRSLNVSASFSGMASA